MKKIIVVLLTAFLCSLLLGCADNESGQQTDGSGIEEIQTNASEADSESDSGGNENSGSHGKPVTPIQDGGTYDYGK